jgi:hypothetical protein
MWNPGFVTNGVIFMYYCVIMKEKVKYMIIVNAHQDYGILE